MKRVPQKHPLAQAIGALALLAGSLHSAAATAGTITVDNGSCTLANAINAANAANGQSPSAGSAAASAGTGSCVGAGSGSNTINLPANSTLSFDTAEQGTESGDGFSALPIIRSTIVINGNGSAVVRSSSASTLFRLFYVGVSNGSTQVPADLTLNRLTVSGGNIDRDGGGILVRNGSLTLDQCTVSGNTTTGDHGGGIGVTFGTTATILRSTISGNSSNFRGGGINNDGTLTISDSTISGNSAFEGGGVRQAQMTSIISDSTITGNTSSGQGGGALVAGGSLTLKNTLVAGNVSPSGSEVFVSPGNGFTPPGKLNGNAKNLFGHSGLTNAQAFGGFTPGATDIVATSDSARATALSSILATNGTPAVPVLANNGGPTPTVALVAGSPAINASDAGATSRDQRGFAPPADGAVRDIGAFEFNGVDPAPSITSLSPASGPAEGGTRVVITGTRLRGATGVKFGAADASLVSSATNTTLIVTSPAGTGTVNVTVTTPDGTSSTTGTADDFTYQSNVSGECGPADAVPSSSTPSANLCSAGTATAVTSNGQFTWQCTGSGTGTTASCSAPYQTQTISTFSANPSSIAIDGTSTITANSTSGKPVSITSDTSAVCSAHGSTVTGLAAGSCSVLGNVPASAANCSSQCFQAAPQVSAAITVNKKDQTIVFGQAPAVVVDGSGTVTATAGSGEAVGFSTAMSAICSVNGSTVTGLKAGNCTVFGNEDGNASYNAAPQASQTFSIGQGSQTITGFKVSAESLSAGGIPASLSAIGGNSGNAVVFASSTPAVCTVSGSSVSGLAEGQCTATANQAGNADYHAAPQVSLTLTVTKPLSMCEAYRSRSDANVIDLSRSTSGQTVRGVSGKFNVIIGSNFADTITGGNAGNCIDGGKGNDRLTAGTGDNYLYGSDGNDTLTPSTGSTAMDGGDGTDKCGRASSRAQATYASCESF